MRIPTESVIDAFSQIHGSLPRPEAICPSSLHDNFDRLVYLWERTENAHLKSQQRKVVGTAPGGWKILLDTNTGAVDFFEAPRTPDALP